jgi:hypothetical protein
MSGASNALFVGREVGQSVGGLWRALFRLPAVFAIGAWIAYGIFAGIGSAAAANPIEVREVRAQCTALPSDEAQGVYRNWATCQPGTGAVIMTNTYDHRPIANAMGQAASWALLFASVFTIGTFTACVLSLCGVTGPGRERHRRRHLARATEHIQRERARADRDVRATKARLGKVGQHRARKWGKRWSREAAAGETYSNPGAVDRWLLRQTKPPKTKAAKKADRAAKKIGKADKRRQTAELDAEWATELAAPIEHQTLLDPTDGPPLSPVQRAEYAERIEMSDRERLAADTAALFEGSAP